ncbi:hypothetical protein ABE036_21810 [Priestia aryabhattai]|uniref:Uncharacterized protein n=1 Tax=Priestia megaterium TaxID=1404 RepID=A0AAX6BL63_PRIMG|nr:hypothetical protein [Priestia aryabhattai]MDE8673364.1 hypothetical protein [Priestia aryabhattai]GMG74521.1 hypothetical protein ShirakiTB12_29890 [Priestia megaterium]
MLSLGPFLGEGGIGIWELEPEPDVEPLGGDIFPAFPKITIPPEIVPIEIDLI